ncbi:PHD finger protein 7-like isoform X1 [Cyanistes caeruleus]|uniref:PHD finger protein 7-like isoform X1 n=1 Tax=Cyanistes caeruleus TaxID=156563 RepID=UPI000CDB7564|nr:PHD finger protein 7-like isoform X1 [Cyanistes caeruleus]
MCDREQEGPDGREPACVLCHRAEADLDICGDKLEKYGLYAHFCLYFATLLFRQANKRVGLLGFLHQDSQLAVRRAAQKHCCVCGQSGATILCWKEDCNRWFHLPCAKEGGCITQYITPYRTYCLEHRPVQIMQVTPELDTECPICMEPVEDRQTFKTMVCPVCKRARFHRDCLQGQALCAGLLYFRCPLCRDHETFLVEMFVMGIQIPIRQPTSEDNNAFADLGERHGRCNARECLYPRGREEAEEEGPWELLLCSSCAAEGTHRRCSGLTVRTTHWECDSCAGLGTEGPKLFCISGELSIDDEYLRDNCLIAIGTFRA